MLRLEILGTPGLVAEDGAAVGPVLARPREFALLAYLAVRPDERHRRDSLLALLWPELDERRARKALRQGLYELRRSLGPDVIRGTGRELVGIDSRRLWCDAAEFALLQDRGEGEAALRIYRGPFLEGFHLSGSATFERWLDDERRRLERAAVATAWRLADSAEFEDPAEVTRWAERAVELSPFDERGFRRYLKLLADRGDLATVLQSYEAFARRLALELDTRPAPETVALVESLRREPARNEPELEVRRASLPRQPVVLGSSGSAASETAGGDEGRAVGRRRTAMWTAGSAAAAVGVILLNLAIASSEDASNAPPDHRTRSILVLPLQSLDEDAESRLFSDGLTEALITELGQVRSLTVFSPSTSMRLRDTEEPIEDIVTQLGADAVLEGSALQVDGRVRITVRLIDGDSAQLVWAESYEEDLRDVLNLQDEIARSVAAEIGVELTREESALLSNARPVAAEAHDAYVRGRYWFAKWTGEGFLEATRAFAEAIAIDPTFAAAHAGHAYSLFHLCYFGLDGSPPAATCQRRVEASALRALELDDQLAEAHVTLGFVRWWGYNRDVRAAEAALQTALRLNPGYAEAHSRYGFLLATLGRHEEALAAFERAYHLDPLSPDRAGFVALELGAAGRFAEAERAARRALALEPDFANTHAWLGFWILAPQGRYDEAIVSLRRALELSGPHALFQAMLGCVLGRAGRTEEAEAILDEMLNDTGGPEVPPANIALVYLGLDENERALDWLERAYREGWGHVIYLNMNPFYEPLRGHPRFERLLRQVGLAG